ncbi:MAG TPA: hypothetical protein VJ643_06505 [Nitrososphaera sp.]|nr:hypothetical protein [Nitrososphaera sp.]
MSNTKLSLAVGLSAATLALVLTNVSGGPAVLQTAGEEIPSPSISAAGADVDTNNASAANVTLNLGSPFLIQNDTETGANVIRVEGSRIIEGTFAGSGEVNGIGYTDNGTVKVVVNSLDGSVHANGTFDIIAKGQAEGEEEKVTVTFEGIGQRVSESVVTNGVYFFGTNSTGKLAFLDNTIAVFKNIQEGRESPLITMAWELK